MHVLLVDDDADIRTVGAYCLRKMGGFEVTTADSASEGIAKALSVRPDVILLDVMMPGADGIECFRWLQASPSTAGIPVLFMTAKVQRHEIERYLAIGARDVIEKPFDPARLPGQVRAYARPS